ncbi:hypothetical protein D9757_010207 [Collybiopsis confluens]|uniref:Transmembrane protein n=1 Tax=Collybiopsis confluens TaxID=2823264 RepID=A0A8H5GPS4_9AGAR|nr:hypothetical protein D9757_010207 [Collybiopsis confluens]
MIPVSDFSSPHRCFPSASNQSFVTIINDQTRETLWVTRSSSRFISISFNHCSMEQLFLASQSKPSSQHRSDYAVVKTVNEDSEGWQGLSSSSLRNHEADNVRRRFLEIMLSFCLAVLIACMNHVLFAHLDKQESGDHTRQFWVNVVKNIFPAAVALLLFMGLKNCLLQVALHHIRLESHPLKLINLITAPPSFLNTLSIISKSSMRVSIICFALLAAIAQAVALTSLFVPGTLAVVSSSPRAKMIQVPTLDFNAVDLLQSTSFENHTGSSFKTPSQRWVQLVWRAASSNTAPTWDPPVGCGTGCTYTFSYASPALTCKDLSKSDIWSNGTNTTDSFLVFGPQSYMFYNSFIYPFDIDITAENLQSASIYITWKTLTRRSARSTSCIAASWIRNNGLLGAFAASFRMPCVKEWNGTLYNILPDGDTTNMSAAMTSIAQSFFEIFSGTAHYDVSPTFLNLTNTQALYSATLFSIVYYPASAAGDDESSSPFFKFGLSPQLGGNLSAGLQSLLGNVTLAFVSESLTTANVEAIMTPNSTQYQYVGWRLGLIYGVVFAFSLGVIGYGLFCLRKDGIVAVFDLQRVVEMTAASSRLHELAGQPEFDSTLVRGAVSPESDGTPQRRLLLDVSLGASDS